MKWKKWAESAFLLLRQRPALALFWIVEICLLGLTPTKSDPWNHLLVCLFWGGVVFLALLAGDPALHKHTVGNFTRLEKGLLVAILIATILLLTLPMGINPVWNGEAPAHRDQYEQITEAFLNGQLHFLYEPSEELLAMENPYDMDERVRLGVDFRWDHALYNGHYYMYFGVVPVLLAFLPYRVVTGTALAAYQATQLFTGMAVVGIFLLFYLIARVYWKKMTFGMYACLSVAFSVMSFWFASGAPALYCTAITAGICMEVWSLYFFASAVWTHKGNVNRQVFLAFWGAVFGALAFGTRPPIALANLLVVPLLWQFLRENRISWKLAGKLVLAALPYLVAACLLMGYNYVRFGSPTEFGQAYQITVADQTGYGKLDISSPWLLAWYVGETIRKVLNGLMENFFSFIPLTETFPYIGWNGVFFNFPILFFVFRLADGQMRRELKHNRIGGFVLTLALVPIVITVADVLWTPYLMERYRMDIYFLLGILAFIAIGFRMELLEQKHTGAFCRWVCLLSLLTVVSCFYFFMVPQESELNLSNPAAYSAIARVLRFGISLPG